MNVYLFAQMTITMDLLKRKVFKVWRVLQHLHGLESILKNGLKFWPFALVGHISCATSGPLCHKRITFFFVQLKVSRNFFPWEGHCRLQWYTSGPYLQPSMFKLPRGWLTLHQHEKCHTIKIGKRTWGTTKRVGSKGRSLYFPHGTEVDFGRILTLGNCSLLG